MQGPSIPLRVRLRVAGLFAIAFVGAALAVFALAHGIGTMLHVSELPAGWRRGLAVATLVALALADLYAVRNRTYSPLSWRRQTPRWLMHRHPPEVVALLWGADTGLAVTTFRVSAATWGALALALLGFATWWTGICYGIGFVLPLMTVISTGRIGEASASPDPMDPGLNRLLNTRPFAQLGSALLLSVSAGMLFLASP